MRALSLPAMLLPVPGLTRSSPTVGVLVAGLRPPGSQIEKGGLHDMDIVQGGNNNTAAGKSWPRSHETTTTAAADSSTPPIRARAGAMACSNPKRSDIYLCTLGHKDVGYMRPYAFGVALLPPKDGKRDRRSAVRCVVTTTGSGSCPVHGRMSWSRRER